MPPKKPAPATAPAPEVMPAASDESEKQEQETASADLTRKAASHPSTMTMMREALKELDSRKGVSSQAIQNYIKQKYPTVDAVRLKYLVRKTLIKGLESGTLVRPANSAVTSGAQGKFRLAPKQAKEPKPKTENSDPNVQKATKEGAKKPKEAGATKKKDPVKKQKSQETAKKAKVEEGATTSKVAPAKRPKAKKAANAEGDGASTSAKPKAKTTKGEKAAQGKAASADGDTPATKATGKRGKKAAE